MKDLLKVKIQMIGTAAVISIYLDSMLIKQVLVRPG